MRDGAEQALAPEPPNEAWIEKFPLSSRYHLRRCIARGGMGSVYEAVQVGAGGFERTVAVKRTHAHLLADPGVRDVILQEARNASAVRHPNVVSINDVEEVDGELLLVMDYIDGASLSSLMQATTSARLPIGVAVSIVLDACAGLEAIHSAKDPRGRPLGLIHRDVSPQNILVGLDGSARISDFGISKSARDPSRTAKGVRRGKFGYMAPEYLLGNGATRSSDIFALGAVLWESFAGCRLFRGETEVESVRLMVDAAVPSLSERDVRIPPSLEAVVRRALARLPADRFASMADFGRELETAARGIVASHAEVAEWVERRLNVSPPPSAPPTLREGTTSLPGLSAAAGSEIKLKVSSTTPPPNAAEATVNVTGAARRRKMARASHLYPAFRLESATPLPHASSPAPETRPAVKHAPHGRSPLALAGLVVFAVFVIATTMALAYAGLAEAPSAPPTQLTHS
jgi:serine/threonine-protein kinase